jgi:hypothetical protein
MTPRLKGMLIAGVGVSLVLLGFLWLWASMNGAESGPPWIDENRAALVGLVGAIVFFAGGRMLWRLGRRTANPSYKPARSFQLRRSSSK